MPKVSAELSPEINQKLKEYIVKTKGTLRGSQSTVIAEAIKEFLERHANN
jgi:predicted transcriptional regulator